MPELTEKTRDLILKLFERVRDGEMTAEEGAEVICGGLSASRRVQREGVDILMRHTVRLIQGQR